MDAWDYIVLKQEFALLSFSEPFFNGGIADLFYGKDLAASSQVITSLKYNLGTLHNPNCPFSVLDLTMDTKDPYRFVAFLWQILFDRVFFLLSLIQK